MHPERTPHVIIRHCDTYDPERIRRIVRESMDELGLRPHGRTLVKPNLVASGPLFPHAYTRPEFTEGVLRALRDRDDGQVEELAVGERCGITVPTRNAFDGAGYREMVDRVGGVKVYYFEEEPQVEIPYTHAGRLRDYVFTPEPVARADFFVNCPKFKAHPWTTVTFGTKAYIGIQDDRHRLIDHDHRLNEKIADLQYIVQPQLLCIDAITAGEGRMLTPIPYDLHLIVIGNNQVAFDAVCCNIIGVDPRTVDHIRLAGERGFGPLDLADIRVTGDVPLEVARERGRRFRTGLIRVEKYFEGTNVSAYAGPPPESEHTDYCWGGCPGAIEEAIEILRLYDTECDKKMPRIHVVFGDYRGPIDAQAGEQVVFIGDCSQWEGELHGKPLQIRSTYRDRSTKDPHHARHDDIFAKLKAVHRKIADAGPGGVVRLEGCPVGVAEQVLYLALAGGLKNPYTSGENSSEFLRGYLTWRVKALAHRMAGRPYQIHGPTPRGAARPGLPAPPPAGE
ncbi:MAG: DUF362 domain-containing protein [Deltaproteobacteria bacterium]|nr:DUF362 domain-containing protein [Deltaproteobacteria bacterium]